jgi:hypothetical protein
MAYDREYIAVRLREAGHNRAATGVKSCCSQLGNIGRDLRDNCASTMLATGSREP